MCGWTGVQCQIEDVQYSCGGNAVQLRAALRFQTLSAATCVAGGESHVRTAPRAAYVAMHAVAFCAQQQ